MSDEHPTAIDVVLDDVRIRLPGVDVERLKVRWPSDDDNLWYIRWNGREVQIESRPEGRAPFLIEGDGQSHRSETSDRMEAVDTIVEWLSSS